MQQTTQKEMVKIRMLIDAKSAELEKIALELESPSSATETSIAYLLLKREIDRLKRILHIVSKEKNAEIESRWISTGSVPKTNSAYLSKFMEITNRYFQYFPQVNFFHRDPPAEHFVHARALEDCGLVQMGTSFVDAKQGSLYYARKKDIEHLLAKKMMKILLIRK